MYAKVAADMATLQAGEAGVEHPNRNELAAQLDSAAARFATDAGQSP
jgi:hypothetical protein